MRRQRILIATGTFLLTLVMATASLMAAAPPLPKYGPAGNPLAVPLSKEHRYLQDRTQAASDFWALIPFYVPQDNDLACSAASVVTVINALNAATRESTSETPNLTQERLLAEVDAAQWRERVTPPGYGDRVGLTLEQLKTASEAALARYRFFDYHVEVREVRETSTAELAKLREVLRENEGTAADFVMVHFLQDELTRSPGGPFAHISPIGAYDAQTRRVLILDVDRLWYEPYWVSDEDLLAAMARPTEKYGHGGYLRIAPGAAAR